MTLKVQFNELIAYGRRGKYPQISEQKGYIGWGGVIHHWMFLREILQFRRPILKQQENHGYRQL